MDCVGSDFRFPQTVVNSIVIANVINVVFVVVVVVGVVVAGVVIGVAVSVVVIVSVAVVLNDGLITITANAICTDKCGDDAHALHVVVNVLNVVVLRRFIVVATNVILDIIFVVSSVVVDIVVLANAVRVVNCTNFSIF